jgi:hypothetical protein
VALPEPKPGLVIRYDYLWLRKAALGRTQSKERPACLVAASDPDSDPRFVIILPITHAQPRGNNQGIEIPPKVRKALGLDDARCWVVVSEYNIDEWPNAGLAPLPGSSGAFAYGFIPPRLFAEVKAKFLESGAPDRRRGVKR